MTNDKMLRVFEFEGNPLSVYNFKGRPCFIAKEVGAHMGYSDDGKKLPDKINSLWADEFIEGKDFDVLKGEDLRAFKALLELTPEKGVSANTPNLMVLYESGVSLACVKTEKPVGKKLRRFLVDEVMPKLWRGETLLGKEPTDMSLARVKEIKSTITEAFEAGAITQRQMVDLKVALVKRELGFDITDIPTLEYGQASIVVAPRGVVITGEATITRRTEKIGTSARTLQKKYKLKQGFVTKLAVRLGLMGDLEYTAPNEHATSMDGYLGDNYRYLDNAVEVMKPYFEKYAAMRAEVVAAKKRSPATTAESFVLESIKEPVGKGTMQRATTIGGKQNQSLPN